MMGGGGGYGGLAWSTAACSSSLPAGLDGGLLLVLFTAKKHTCRVGREGLLAGEFHHVHLVPCQDPTSD